MIVSELIEKLKDFPPEPTKPAPQEQSIARMNRETTITKEELDRLWNALEYTRATISPGCRFELSDAKDSLKDD